MKFQRVGGKASGKALNVRENFETFEISVASVFTLIFFFFFLFANINRFLLIPVCLLSDRFSFLWMHAIFWRQKFQFSSNDQSNTVVNTEVIDRRSRLEFRSLESGRILQRC